ncbi:hypothetical protein AVEN_202554-1 [Araneus ventricosus]|uniref:Uncharacterized protein n=1 Tax=Araneus ventricosus TaxID=182803 RepID=A0A4Y2IQL8_ARAVE|nr:hypothetical protein AVEN_202554-1 [Araneus ventricosus]
MRSPRIKDEICTKRYLRHFLKETQTGQDGYPLYRRRSSKYGAFIANISFRESEVSIDNTCIVAFCLFLLKKFQCAYHSRVLQFCEVYEVDLQICHKGTEMAVCELPIRENDLNEIRQHQMGRYIDSKEAVWRILNFPIHERYTNGFI